MKVAGCGSIPMVPLLGDTQ